jgi:glucose-6-phosphate isomerase
MDSHFVETNPRHNLPILLALTDVWNDSFLGSNGRIISPYTEAFAAYPAFCACLEVQTCGAAKTSDGGGSSLVVDGGLHCAYDRVLYLGDSATPSEMVMTMNSQLASNAAAISEDDINQTQDTLICSMFAHADELAFGGAGDHHHPNNYLGGNRGGNVSVSNLSADGGAENMHSDGNRPSTLLMCGICDAFACGELVALAEHRAIVKARIWDVDPFPKEFGSALRADRTERIKERLQEILMSEEDAEDDDDQDLSGMNLSTKTILRHYASQVRDQRVNNFK